MVLPARIRSRAALRLRAFSFARRLTSSSLRFVGRRFHFRAWSDGRVRGREKGSWTGAAASGRRADQLRASRDAREGGGGSESRPNESAATTPRTIQKAALVAADGDRERIGEARTGRARPRPFGVGRARRGGARRGAPRPPTFAAARGARRQQRHAPAAEHPTASSHQSWRSRRPASNAPGTAGRSPMAGFTKKTKKPAAPQRSPRRHVVAPPRQAKTATREEREPDRGRHVREGGAEGAPDAVLRTPMRRRGGVRPRARGGSR